MSDYGAKERLMELTDKPEFVSDIQDDWKIKGFKFQVAAEGLLRKMGHTIIKAQHELIPRKSVKDINTFTLGDYLWNYSDYITVKRRHVYIIDVKAQLYTRLKTNQGWNTLGFDNSVSFTKKEIQYYKESIVPVMVLLILYNDERDCRNLGPAYIRLVPFSDFKFSEGSNSGFLSYKKKGSKRLTSQEVYDLLRRMGALDIKEIGPGYVKRK